MPVYLPCEKCQKRLKIPESVLGRAIKCPACGGVFKSEASKVLPTVAAPGPSPVAEVLTPVAAAPPTPAAVPQEERDEAIYPARKKAAIIEEDEEEEDIRPVRKKVVAVEDEDEEADEKPARAPKPADDEDEPAEVEELEEAEEEDGPKKARRRHPWYVVLPLLLLSFTGAGLAWLWTIGFSWLDLDRGVDLSFETRMMIGIGLGAGVFVLCLILSLIPVRAGLRFFLVLALLALGYGGSFATMYFWKDLPFSSRDSGAPPTFAPPPLQGPAGGRIGPGGPARGGPQ
jgi:hypothetical protein